MMMTLADPEAGPTGPKSATGQNVVWPLPLKTEAGLAPSGSASG